MQKKISVRKFVKLAQYVRKYLTALGKSINECMWYIEVHQGCIVSNKLHSNNSIYEINVYVEQ